MEAAARTKKRPRTTASQIDIPYWGVKRARTDLPSCRDGSRLRSSSALSPPNSGTNMDCLPDPHNNNWRDWAGLDDGPAGLVAERVLAYDVAGYVRFRAVCRPWRHCCTGTLSHNGLDRRFHPWRWTMLRVDLAAPDRRCFLNTFTSQCIQVDIPELHDYELLAITPEGLLVLALKPPCTTTISLLNPLTRHLIQLPPLSTLVPPEYQDDMLPERGRLSLQSYFKAWGSGIANDDSTVVLCLSTLRMIGIAKPGDDHWTLVDCDASPMTTPIMFEGRFYCVSLSGVMVLETGPPRLEVATKLNNGLEWGDNLHLVNNCGDLMLVHRRLLCWSSILATKNKLVRHYEAYRVDLDSGTLFLVKSLGGRAVFMGMDFSLSVSLDVFPSGSIAADTIYLSSDVDPRARAYHLTDGDSEGTRRYKGSLVPRRPLTIADCLSLSVTR